VIKLQNIRLNGAVTMAAKDFKCVIIESPFRGRSPEEFAFHLQYLQFALRDAIGRGESPYASHQMLTTALDDEIQIERSIGISAGQAWMRRADLVAVYTDLGISDGMNAGIATAKLLGKPIEYRKLNDE
jgi:hypothetical protein